MICPISRELLADPVVAEDGHTYEAVPAARQAHARTHMHIEPMAAGALFAIILVALCMKKLIAVKVGEGLGHTHTHTHQVGVRSMIHVRIYACETPTHTRARTHTHTHFTHIRLESN